MKKRLCLIVTIILLFGSTNILAQVKIGDNPSEVNPGSLLELESTNKGLLLPRLADTTSITNPPQGMFMFNNNDTSLYFRRLGGWRRLSSGEDNYWQGGVDKAISPKLLYITDNAPVIVNNQYSSSPLYTFPFQTIGMYGNTLAKFGSGSYTGIAGISLVGNWPGVFFNSYYYNGCKNMDPGYSGNISLNPTTGNYYFTFQDSTASAGALVNQHTKMYLTKDGQLSLNTPGISSRAWMEEQGAISNTCAIFGGEGSGVAIEEHWPSIGFNTYYNGVHKSIGAGFGGEIGIDQNNGDFYLTSMGSKATSLDQPISAGAVRSFNINPKGYVGINTMNPNAQIEINQTASNSIVPSNGLMFTSHEVDGTNQYTSSFSISGHTGFLNGDNRHGYPYLVFQSGNFSVSPCANIDVDGNYHQVSDARFKKDITSLDQSSMLQKLLLLKPSNYHFINERTAAPKSYGFLAQDVEKIFPEFVDEIQGKKMLAYSSFVPVIVAAVQEQQQEIENLKTQNHVSPTSVQNENSDLKNQVANLTEMVKQLQQRVNVLEKRVK